MKRRRVVWVIEEDCGFGCKEKWIPTDVHCFTRESAMEYWSERLYRSKDFRVRPYYAEEP
jgi:hypothetical protein